MGNRNLLFAFLLAMQAIGISTAFLGYHYLQLVNDFRDRNFEHLTQLQASLDLIAENYFPTSEQLDAIDQNLSTARANTLRCSRILNTAERALFRNIGVNAAMALCRRDVATADNARDIVAEMAEIAATPGQFGSQYLEHKNELEQQLKIMKAHSQRIRPHVDRIEDSVVSFVRVGTMGTGIVLAFLIALVSRNMGRLIKRLEFQNTALESANQRFDLALRASKDGFALYDENLRLVAFNRLYSELSSLTPDYVRIGMHVSEVVRNGAQTGTYPNVGPEDIEDFVADMTEKMRLAENETFDFELSGDRHVRASISQSSLGDKVVLRSEVTDYVRAHRAQREHAESLSHANQAIRHKSLHDALTDLPNRRLLDKKLAVAIEQRAATVIRIDLDRFKQVNDVLGHKAGDFVLCHVADILRSEVRSGDLAARCGGDEFVVLCRADTSVEQAREIAERLLARIVEPLSFEGKPCRFGASFGVAASTENLKDGDELLCFADAALYAAKNAGRRTIEVFSPALHEKYVEERLMGDEFATALESGQIVPYFQTQHDARTHAVVGAEVLARWHHPRRGVLAPDAFLDVVRKLGMEGRLDGAIFDRSVEIVSDLAAEDLYVPKLSFNVSAGRIMDPEFVETARRSLSIDRPHFAFELLESISLEDMDDVFRFTIDSLKELGFDIEIDDFGSGHASIASVLDIAPHALKIDRRLVRPLGDSDRAEQMIASIVHFAQAMDIRVTAEGVETETQARVLAELGCNTLQGYLFSRPEPAESLRKRLLSRPRIASG